VQGLLNLFEEDLDLPAAPVQFHDALGDPLQVVGEKLHLHVFAIHLDQRHHPAQQLRIILPGGRGLELDQLVTKNPAKSPFLVIIDHRVLQVVLGSGDPKDQTQGQIRQMADIDISLVKYDDFAGFDPGAQFPRLLGVVVPGGIDNGKARQETLQVQPQVAFGRRLATSVFGPVQAGGDQWNCRGIHQMNRPLELPRKAFACLPADETRRQDSQMLQHRPEKLFGHLGWAHLVGVGEGVAIGRGGTTQTGKWSRMQPQRVADIIESDAVGELGIQQRDQITPGTERAGFILNPGRPRQLGNEKVGNEVAHLPQQIQLGTRWNVSLVFFHPRRVAGLHRTVQLFFKILWDGCESVSPAFSSVHAFFSGACTIKIFCAEIQMACMDNSS
jgi:hypothetical protein